MAFDKDYPNRKDIRKSLRKGKAVSVVCRNHGGCPWCSSNRQHNNTKKELISKEKFNEYLRG